MANIADDVIIHGKNSAEHDRILTALLERLQDKGHTVNREKCKIKMQKLTLFGHDLSARGIEPC